MTYTFDENIVSDLHKDAYGFRPRESFWDNWMDMDDDGRQAEWDHLLSVLKRTMDEAEQTERDMAEYFESRITETMSVGAWDRPTAIQWIIKSVHPTEYDLLYGAEWVCWYFQLPWSYRPELEPICKQLLEQATVQSEMDRADSEIAI